MKTSRMKPRLVIHLTILIVLVMHVGITSTAQVTLVRSGYIYDNAPFSSCHASTLVELKEGNILASWFGGSHEGHKDVAIWTSVLKKGKWSAPERVADGVVADTLRYPCWNPVLFRSISKEVFLYYKVGPSPREWWGMMIRSNDDGKSWSDPARLPDGILGPIKNKPVQLKNGTILHPSSIESLDEKQWIIHLETSDSRSDNWQKVLIDCDTFGVIQPAILIHPNNKLQMLSRSRQNAIVQTSSTDNGRSWSPLSKIPLVNPNSGIDAVTLSNGKHLLVYNPGVAGKEWYNGRNELRVALSDDGINWNDVWLLEKHDEGEYSYPAVIQSRDGLVHITYTYDRKKIKYVVLKL